MRSEAAFRPCREDGGPPAEMRMEFGGTPVGVRRALRRLMRACDPLPLDPEERGSVELVLAEALNNVVEHAYDGKGGWVRLHCAHAADGLHVTIRDRGAAMPGGRVPLGEGPATGAEPMEGGFGWFIIRDIARDIAYRREGEENVLSFRIAVALGATLH